MSDSPWPHRRQPTRLPRPWDSPGKNTGVGCHFLLQCMKVKSEREAAQLCLTLSDPMDCSPPGPSIHGIFQARVLEWGAIAFSDHIGKEGQKKWNRQKPYSGQGRELGVREVNPWTSGQWFSNLSLHHNQAPGRLLKQSAGSTPRVFDSVVYCNTTFPVKLMLLLPGISFESHVSKFLT